MELAPTWAVIFSDIGFLFLARQPWRNFIQRLREALNEISPGQRARFGGGIFSGLEPDRAAGCGLIRWIAHREGEREVETEALNHLDAQ